MIDNVAVDEPILASTMNALINGANGSPGRAVYLADGVFSVPAGVQRFKVTLCGGGGGGGAAGSGGGGEDLFVTQGGPGGDAPMISAIFTGYDEGASIPVIVGAGGDGPLHEAGETTSFATLSSTGGLPGATGPSSPGGVGTKGNPGTGNFPVGAPSFFHTNELFGVGYTNKVLVGYGRGGVGGNDGVAALDGRPGIVVIEW